MIQTIFYGRGERKKESKYVFYSGKEDALRYYLCKY